MCKHLQNRPLQQATVILPNKFRQMPRKKFCWIDHCVRWTGISNPDSKGPMYEFLWIFIWLFFFTIFKHNPVKLGEIVIFKSWDILNITWLLDQNNIYKMKTAYLKISYVVRSVHTLSASEKRVSVILATFSHEF